VSGGRATIEAVGHRVVHGGSKLVVPTLITPAVVRALESLNELAPLHNPAALQGIRAARRILGARLPMVAVFDTAFHSTIPRYAATYALPRELTERHHIRRYGFHGLAHEFMLRRYAELQRIPVSRATIITLQLGNGCSVTAIRNGKSVDTSMGFTPLEGLVMGTRSGDLDPSLVSFLMRKEKRNARQIERLLNEQSGLRGISGGTSDMRDLVAAMKRDERAALAVEMFCYRIRKYLGAYLAVLGGGQAVVFGGGIGENEPQVREIICAGMDWCGLRLDRHKNAKTLSRESRISADGSRVRVFVIPVDESSLIAQHVTASLRG
jgi:acetate kinase